MKKLLFLILVTPFMFSCGQNKSKEMSFIGNVEEVELISTVNEDNKSVTDNIK